MFHSPWSFLSLATPALRSKGTDPVAANVISWKLARILQGAKSKKGKILLLPSIWSIPRRVMLTCALILLNKYVLLHFQWTVGLFFEMLTNTLKTPESHTNQDNNSNCSADYSYLYIYMHALIQHYTFTYILYHWILCRQYVMLLFVRIKRQFFPESKKYNCHWLQNKREVACSSGNPSVFSSCKLNFPSANWEYYEKWEQVFAQEDS